MKTLYIDTTSNYLYSAIVSNCILTDEIKLKLDNDLSVFTLSEISNMIKRNDLTPKDINKIIVVNGPGSFTGIRIGVTIAKTFAYGLDIDITTITSLDAMSLSSNSDATFIVPIIDARRGYVYAGIYDNENNIVFKNQYIKLETLKNVISCLPGKYNIISNDNIADFVVENYTPNMLKIINKYCEKESIDPHNVNPEYLKLTEAEEKQGEVL